MIFLLTSFFKIQFIFFIGVQRLYRWTIDACRSTSSGSGMTPMDSDLLPGLFVYISKL